jgi:hypothetical protein
MSGGTSDAVKKAAEGIANVLAEWFGRPAQT